MFFLLCFLTTCLQLWIGISRLREVDTERSGMFGFAYLLLGAAWALLMLDADNSPVRPLYLLYVFGIPFSIANWCLGVFYLRRAGGGWPFKGRGRKQD
jgi:hypothetical protein